MYLQLEHFVEDSNSNLESNTGKEADQDRSRQEIGKEAELKQTSQQQEPSREQRYESRQRGVMCAPVARPARPAARMAAVAESEATTR